MPRLKASHIQFGKDIPFRRHAQKTGSQAGLAQKTDWVHEYYKNFVIYLIFLFFSIRILKLLRSDIPQKTGLKSKICISLFYVSDFFEFVVSGLNFFVRKLFQSFKRKILNIERCHYTTVNYGFSQIVFSRYSIQFSDVTNEPSGKSVPGTGRVKNVFKRIRRGRKEAVL